MSRSNKKLNMKIYIVFFALIAVLLTSCTKYDSQINEIDFNSSEHQTKHTDIEETINSYNQGECEAPGYFTNLTDFYMFATTGSRDPSLYTDPYTSENISWYHTVDSKALIRIEDMFGESFTQEVKEILIVDRDNCYSYILKNEIDISIEYNPQKFISLEEITEKLENESTKYIEENDTDNFTLNAKDGKVYVKKINGVTVHRRTTRLPTKGYVYCFDTVIDGYRITINTFWPIQYDSQTNLSEDHKKCIESFFMDDELLESVETLKKCIEYSNKYK